MKYLKWLGAFLVGFFWWYGLTVVDLMPPDEPMTLPYFEYVLAAASFALILMVLNALENID